MEIENYRTFIISKDYIQVEHEGGNNFYVQFKLPFNTGDELFREVLEHIEADDFRVVIGILPK